MSSILHGDCLNLMQGLSDNSVDMLLSDLPFGCTQHPDDIPLDLDLFWMQAKRVVKPSGVIALFAQGLFYVDLVNSNRSMFRYDLIWDKVLTSGFGNARRMPLRSHEQIAIFYRRLGTYNPQMTEGKPLHSKGTKYLEKEVSNQNYGRFKPAADLRKGSTEKFPKSILSFAKPHPSIAKHRTEKSVAGLEWLVKTYTNEGDLVLDPCAGSGTTGVACLNTNRDFILMEKDKKYFELINSRMENF